MSQTSDNDTNKKIGLSFPLRLEDDGSGGRRLSSCTDAEHIRQSIRSLLLTARGRRVMRPDFGNRLGDYLFENIGATTAALVKNEIKGTIARFEPRVALDDIEVREGAGGLGTISVEIAYRILSTGMTDRLAIDIGR